MVVVLCGGLTYFAFNLVNDGFDSVTIRNEAYDVVRRVPLDGSAGPVDPAGNFGGAGALSVDARLLLGYLFSLSASSSGAITGPCPLRRPSPRVDSPLPIQSCRDCCQLTQKRRQPERRRPPPAPPW